MWKKQSKICQKNIWKLEMEKEQAQFSIASGHMVVQKENSEVSLALAEKA